MSQGVSEDIPNDSIEPDFSTIDVGIITVLDDCELPAVAQVFDIDQEDPWIAPDDDQRYWFNTLESISSGRKLRLAITSTGMAGRESARETKKRMIDRFNPLLLILVGSAAGKSWENRGQVIIGEQIINIDMSGKRVLE